MAKIVKAGIDAATAMEVDAKVRKTVEDILEGIRLQGDAKIRELSEAFDNLSLIHI